MLPKLGPGALASGRRVSVQWGTSVIKSVRFQVETQKMSKRPHSQNHCDTLKNTHTEMQTLSPTVCDQPPLTARCSLPIFVRECTSEYPQWPDMVLGGMAGVSSKLWAPSASRQASQDVRGARRFEGSGAGEAPAQGCLLRTDDSGMRPSGEVACGLVFAA